MDPDEYLEEIYNGIMRNWEGLEEWTTERKKDFFRNRAKAHNPPIDDDVIEDFISGHYFGE